MKLQDRVTAGRVFRPPRMIVYGIEGIGKSTFAASAPNAIVVQTEDGLDQINVSRLPLIGSFAELMSDLAAIRDEEHDYRTLVVDSADWAEAAIQRKVCEDCGAKSMELAAGGYGKAYGIALDLWRQTLRILDEIRLRRNMMVILTAHSRNEHVASPETADFDRVVPRLHKTSCALLTEWADIIGYATRKMRVDDNGKANGIGAGGGDRILRTTGSPACLAKCRYPGVPETLPLDFSTFMDALRKGQEHAE